MDIIVCIKQNPDLQQIRIKNRQPILEGVPMVFGDLDKNALEEAIKIKEAHGGKVVVLSLGTAKLKEGVKEPLAMGADEAYIVTNTPPNADPSFTAQVLADAVKKIGNFDLILCGEASSDDYTGQVPSRLAEILDLPQATYVRKVEVQGDKVILERNLEDGFEVVEATGPVLVSVAGEINEPRLPSVMQIMKANKKPKTEWSVADVSATAASEVVEVKSNLAEEQDRKNQIFEGPDAIDKFVDALIREGVLGR